METILGDGGAGGGGGGRFFGGADRRLRPHNHQALKCPRCESLNTKFCYYNNYNLSQPRHFCKSCRRYWTKGGVLRNVPVGGGCRKNKRSKSKSSAAAEAPTEGKSRNKSDSSDSSSLTAAAAAAETTTPKAIPVPAEEVSASNNSSSVPNFPDARLFDVNPEANQSFENHDPSARGEIFPVEIGGFASLITTAEEAAMGFGGIGDIPLTASFERAEPVNQAPVVDNAVQTTATAAEEFKMEEGIAAALDWGDNVDQGRFDLTTGVDQGRFDLTAGVDPADWSQHHWTVNDQSLHYFPYI